MSYFVSLRIHKTKHQKKNIQQRMEEQRQQEDQPVPSPFINFNEEEKRDDVATTTMCPKCTDANILALQQTSNPIKFQCQQCQNIFHIKNINDLKDFAHNFGIWEVEFIFQMKLEPNEREKLMKEAGLLEVEHKFATQFTNEDSEEVFEYEFLKERKNVATQLFNINEFIDSQKEEENNEGNEQQQQQHI